MRAQLMNTSGYITRGEIAAVAGLLLARPGEPAETIYVQATTTITGDIK
ncbi:hypothetical protein ACQPYK_25160 [Streptosporangium sp. CA-135522]